MLRASASAELVKIFEFNPFALSFRQAASQAVLLSAIMKLCTRLNLDVPGLGVSGSNPCFPFIK